MNSSDVATFQTWVAAQMSELLAAAPEMARDPPSTRVTNFIPREINYTCNGNVNEFARLVGVNNITVYCWCYDRAVPQNDLMLKVCFATGKPYAELLTGKGSRARLLARRKSVQTVLITGFRRHTSGEVRRALLAALKVDPPPSLREVSDSLGYKSDFLSVRYPKLRERIRKRYQNYRVQNQVKYAETREPDDQTIEFALQKALEAAIPPSIQQLGRELGYPDRYTGRKRFKKKFPDLCKAVSDKRKSYLSSRRESIRRNLEQALELEPPPTLNETIELLGFKDTNYLRKYYPDLCRAIVQRNGDYRKAEFNGMRAKLIAIFHEREPISLRAAATRLGGNPAYLGSCFPVVCKAISRRFRRYLSERSRQRKKEGATKIRATAFKLHAKGIYPSAKTIVKFLNGRQTLTLTEIGYILRKVRRTLKIHSP